MTKSHFLIVFVAFCVYNVIDAEIPNCSFDDTVELKEVDKLNNGSYIYEGIVIPPSLIGEFDYKLGHAGEKEPVANHTRGCVCKLKPCIRLCCHPKAIFNLTTYECDSNMQEDLKLHPYVNITFGNNTAHEVHVLEDFVSQRGRPCSYMYPLSAEEYEDEKWKLFENGTLFTSVNEGYYSKQQYCLQPSLHLHTNEHVFKPHLCAVANEPSVLTFINVALMMISVIFFILTIVVYLFVPKLQNLNGKCLICYLTALAGSFTFIFFNVVYPPSAGLPCDILGYVGYFLTISAFAWSSVISFDLWNTFRGLKYASMRPNIIFRMYNLFAWGTGALFLIVIGIIDIVDNEDWISGIGVYSCWIASQLTIPRIYLYGPMCIMLVFNTVMFILSALKIIEIKKRLQQSDVREDHARRLSTNRQMYSLFLRLFFIMGIAWILELLSSFGMNTFQEYTDIFCASQGIIIFVLLVLRPKVRRLVMERIRCQRNTSHGSESSNEGISLQEKTVAVPTLL